MKAGLSPVEALRMGTIDAARWRGQDATEGSVEPGKVADLGNSRGRIRWKRSVTHRRLMRYSRTGSNTREWTWTTCSTG